MRLSDEVLEDSIERGELPVHKTELSLKTDVFDNSIQSLAAIGSGYGGGLTAGASCESVARQPRSAHKLKSKLQQISHWVSYTSIYR